MMLLGCDCGDDVVTTRRTCWKKARRGAGIELRDGSDIGAIK
jgi:hypothetical protein